MPNLLQKFCAHDIYSAAETFILLCHPRRFHKLQTHNSVWFKESIGSCNKCCEVQPCQEPINRSCLLLKKGLAWIKKWLRVQTWNYNGNREQFWVYLTNWNFCLPASHPWYSQWTRESYWIWGSYDMMGKFQEWMKIWPQKKLLSKKLSESDWAGWWLALLLSLQIWPTNLY